VTWALVTRVDPQELDLETSDVLLTVGVVANDTKAGLFTQVVLIFLEEYLRLTFGRSHTEEASDIRGKREFLLDLGALEGWTVNVNHPCALEGGYLALGHGPVFHVLGCELSAKTVLNTQLSLFDVTTEHHASWEPLRNLERERVRHLAREWRSIHKLGDWEDHAEDREIAEVISVDSPLALSVRLSEIDVFSTVETDRQVRRCEAWLLQVDVNQS